MRSSDWCVYCGVEMNNIPNDAAQKTVEHMIPNISLLTRRNKSEGDFHACKKCNSEKSYYDKIIGLSIRLASSTSDAECVVNRLAKSIEHKDVAFLKLIDSIKIENGKIIFTIPLTYKQTEKYGIWLAKGILFIKTGQYFNSNTHIVCVDLISQENVSAIKNWYQRTHQRDAFDDLSLNKKDGIANIQKTTFLVCSEDGLKSLIFFNKVLAFNIEILDTTRANITKRNKTIRRLKSSWNR